MSVSSVSVAVKMSFNNKFVEWVSFKKEQKNPQLLIKKKLPKRSFDFTCPHHSNLDKALSEETFFSAM